MDIAPVLRHAFTQGPGKTIVTAPIVVREVPPTTAGQLPPGRSGSRSVPLPPRTVDLLERIPFWTGRVDAAAMDRDEVHGRVVTTAFGYQRREPWNEYPDHRGYASVRSRYPVHAFAVGGGEDWFADMYGHRLVGRDRTGHGRTGPVDSVALTGRYTHLPYYYELLRGSLVDLEVGINLRSLCVALELFGVPSTVRVPDATGPGLLHRLGLVPDGEWSLPLTVDLAGSEPESEPEPDRRAGEITAAVPGTTGGLPDPWLREIVRYNREQAVPRTGVLASPHVPEVPEVQQAVPVLPPAGPAREQSWAEVLYRRSSGKMPRGLPGITGRPRRLDSAALADALAWCRVPPPSPELRAVQKHLRITLAVQNVDGCPPGVYRVTPDGESLVTEDASICARLEGCYGTPLTARNGNAIRHASMVWFVSVRLPELLADLGTGAWTTAQHCAGWAAHGISLAAAQHGMYARPSRAFEDILTQPVLSTDPGETTLLSVVCGTERYTEPALDLRV
ncbi:hypothetical protein [Kitasatospora sp. SUK 42]|uniref:hypothetical protein n=1 Tax=Kitasatospora sp. SUK 42 TaxID=1588882 RepID=UPI0018C9E0E8|nr:hypothetical protein [Kitasatospora sp. SUK 42]MBV2153687.1 hypothetical protein [Kitasatospora sp. SUK 42]